ncbi:MAG TPA: ATP-dependent RNA helicase HrpA [Casimicrobiaceae bacterium]|nr:ATP-dependent RNA helicase HrpA [Casimicrobiaceae bacterium]
MTARRSHSRQSFARSVERRAQRALRRPAITYPEELPVSRHAREIGDAIRANPVVIVAGATGSGKTTQLPKICLDIGRGEHGLIGHTQPRRIAARAVATRIAQELGSELGDLVGYKVRFTEQTSPDAFVKLMTDGILLAETQGDRMLRAYDTIIVDEAHERSLNIDFLLGYLHQLLPKRPELKVIITSATIDAQRFAEHFAQEIDGKRVPAPVIEVSGRLYPVEVRYRALRSDEEGDDEEEMEDAVVAAAEELWRERAGDMLVFLPGEREIRETQELLRKSLARRPYAREVEILPLFARLTVAEQQRVFAPGRGRRIVLATNVAETSLTVPGIRYVIDTGVARIKRYSVRNKTTLLQIEKISQAAANQRAGRCGRVAEGICVRLYSEEDFASRPLYTDPEILRSSLASVILRMGSLELGRVEDFPFLEPPLPRAIADGYQLLQELGAVATDRMLTPLGRELARLPVDARVARMILEARERGCLAEVLVIASALSVPDPRDRPLEKQQAADQAHLRFRDERSDFLSLLALWEFFAAELAKKQSHRALVDACRAQFVSWLRLREWRDVHAQLATEIREQGWKWSDALPPKIDAARYQLVHQSLLTGLLSNIGQRSEDGDGYLGVRGLRFYLHPGSGLVKKPPRWTLAAELVETSRLFARCAARIEPEWVETVAGDRVTRDYFEPHWDDDRGEVVASERVQLYGLTLVPRRRVSYGRIDPAVAREVFIREALVPGTLKSRGAFLAHNRHLIAEVQELEQKARRQDVLVDDESMAAFYDARLPAQIHSLASFEHWRGAAERENPRLLFMTRRDVMRHDAANVTAEWFPDALAMAGTRLALKYRFAPGHPLDGLTITVPLPLLNQIDAARLTWLVPGLVREKVTFYLRALPKAWRNRLIPLPDVVTAFLQTEPSQDEALPAALRAYVRARLGDAPPADVWDHIELPPHLVMNIRVVDDAGRELAQGRDLAALRGSLGEAAQLSFAESGPAMEKRGLRKWDFGELPESITRRKGSQRVTGFPALVDEGDSVAITLLDTAEAAQSATRAGVVRLIRIALADALARYEKGPPGFASTVLALKPAVGADKLLAEALDAICDRAFVGEDPLPRSEKAFTEQVKRARTRLPAVAESAFRLLAAIATRYQALNQRVATIAGRAPAFAAEIRARRDGLVYPGFFSGTPWNHLNHVPRYLEALERRVAKFAENPARDARHAGNVAAWWQRYLERVEKNREAKRQEPALAEFRWLLEELSVSLFAQELKTPLPVSYKRVEKAWAEIGR